ncbi:hypothetical protein Hte_001931 [Hypoxylon texense]
MSADALRDVRHLAEGEGPQDSEQAKSNSSIDSKEKLVESGRLEIEQLRHDVNAPVAQRVTALLRLGAVLADYPDLGDAEPSFREAKELMDTDAASEYSLERLVCVQMWARVLQETKRFDGADALYTDALNETRHSRGREHPWTSELQNNLGCLRTAAGMWYDAQGLVEKANVCFDGAHMLFEKSYKAKLCVFGRKHRATLKTKCNIDIVSFLRRRALESESRWLSGLTDALEELKRFYGPKDSSVKEVANHLVGIYRTIEDFGKADMILKRFGVDTPRDYRYDIQPFKDDFIPRPPTPPKSTDSASTSVDGRQNPAEALRIFLHTASPSQGRNCVQMLSRVLDYKIAGRVGRIGIHTTLKAVGLSSLAELETITMRREELLEQAAAAAHFEAVEFLLQTMSKASGAADGEALIKAFYCAVESGNADVIRLFLNYGVKPSAAGRPTLHMAAALGLEDAFAELLKWGENIDLKNSNGDTALDVALKGNHEQIIRAVMINKRAMIASSRSTMDTGTKETLDEPQVKVWEKTLYTGLDATIVNFYIDQTHEVEEHLVQTEPVEDVVSNSDLLRNVTGVGEPGEKADFTWIHVPANNMVWIETLMKNLADVNDGLRYSDLMTKEVWQNQLHESMHGAFHGRFMKPFCGKINDIGSQVVLYMPYIHWESNSMKKEMDETIKEIDYTHRVKLNLKKLLERTPPGENDEHHGSTSRSADFQLLDRTFDQFRYFMDDDTAARDADQVVSRYFERRHPDATVPIMMVDQLWMWIIDNSIMKHCPVLFHDTDEEIRRFNYFADGGRVREKAKKRKSEGTEDNNKWLRYLLKRWERILPPRVSEVRFGTGDAQAAVNSAANAKRRWSIKEKDIEKVFDISDETELLKEIKDIQDEINILQTLFDQQSRVLSSYHSASGGRTRPSNMAGAVKRLVDIVKKMDVDTQRPRKALEDLLDLKQKQANVFEARSTRVSGTTITVFTIVTTVFLPASFVVAFFALPIAEYPFVDEQLHLDYAIKWTMSVTAAIAVPLIIFALYVNPIVQFIRTYTLPTIFIIVVPNLIYPYIGFIGAVVVVLILLLILAVVAFMPALLVWLCAEFADIFTSFCKRAILFISDSFKWIIQCGGDYRAAKKEAIDRGGVWSKRRYIPRGLLQRRPERRATQDEEEQRGSSSQGS